MASNKDRGYIVAVIYEKEKKKFECMLCLAIIKKATHGCKNHVFCKECLNDYINSIERTEDSLAIQIKCPSGCGHTFNKNELISNDYADQLINQMSCRCKDCDWSGDLIDFVQVHEGKCIEKEVPCLLCSMALKRKSLNHHMKDECTHRPVVCRGCRKNFPFVDHLKHEESCDDIKVECSFINFGCNVQETRRNMITHENNYNKQHLCLIAKYFTDENKQLKEETKQLKEENKQFKRESNQSKKKTELLEEEIIQVKEKVKILTCKVNIQQNLLKEPASKFIQFPAVDEMHIKNINIWSPYELLNCINQNNFTWIIEHLVRECDVFSNYEEQLNELFSTSKTIMFINRYFFQLNDFQCYKSKYFSVKKDGNIFHIENQGNHYMTFYISKWFIKINKGMTQIDVTKPDEQFIVSRLPSLSSKYFSVSN